MDTEMITNIKTAINDFTQLIKDFAQMIKDFVNSWKKELKFEA